MNSFLVVFALAAVANAIPSHQPILIAIGHTQASSYKLKTDHPVQEPAPIIKGVPQPYAVPVPQPYAVPRAVPIAVPRAVPVHVTRTVGVPVIAQGEPIVNTRYIRTESRGLELGGLDNGGYGLGGLNGGLDGLNGGYGGYGKGALLLSNGDDGLGYGKGLRLDGLGYGKGLRLDGLGYGKGLRLDGLGYGKGLSLGLSDGLEYGKY